MAGVSSKPSPADYDDGCFGWCSDGQSYGNTPSGTVELQSGDELVFKVNGRTRVLAMHVRRLGTTVTMPGLPPGPMHITFNLYRVGDAVELVDVTAAGGELLAAH